MAIDSSARRALDWPGPPEKLVELCTPAEAQAQYLSRFAEKQSPLEPVADSKDMHIGSMRIKIWRGHGAPATGAPALLYLHGGGWVIGAPETHEDICRHLANAVGAVVISPDYRLAPEHRFPLGLEDCASTLRWLVQQSEALGIDPGRVVVGGDSAGGNLAAVIALMARDGAVPAVIGQLLIYPATDMGQDTDSFRRSAEGFGLTAAASRWFRDQYLAQASDVADWRVSPLRVESVAGTAPAFIVLAGNDVLLDEGLAYARRLEAEGTASFRT